MLVKLQLQLEHLGSIQNFLQVANCLLVLAVCLSNDFL